MKHWCVWVWFTAGLFMACSSENQWLDTALNLAGDNRAELQKVLDRYKEEDGDKYRAACFLIENMPFHGAYEERPWRITGSISVNTFHFLIPGMCKS